MQGCPGEASWWRHHLKEEVFRKVEGGQKVHVLGGYGRSVLGGAHASLETRPTQENTQKERRPTTRTPAMGGVGHTGSYIRAESSNDGHEAVATDNSLNSREEVPNRAE